MSNYQWADKNGNIVLEEYNRASILDSEGVKKEIRDAFSCYNKNVTIDSINNLKEVYKVTINQGLEDFRTIYISVKPTTPGGRSNLKDEQRIQQKPEYINYVNDKLQNGDEAALIGIYKRDDVVIFCAWKLTFSSANSTISKQIKINTIANAIKYGFAQQKQRSTGEYVCAFRKEFIYFYLQNSNWIHNNDVEQLNKNSSNIMEVEDQEKKEIPDLSIINFPHQRIFFGAPGTGKSYLLNKQAKENFGENYERVTFHPNYMYGSFIGTFKPFPVKLKDNNEEFLTDDYGNIKEYITYKYVPGVLMKVLVKALVNPKTNYLLIIEEINRADVSAVFGDFFQLLDRCKNGESQYPIATSEDIKIYFNEIFKSKNILPQKLDYIKDKIGTEYDKIILPNNLYIWATMNSADQGVTYMDTAFKRRWDIVYVGVDDAAKDKEFDNYRFKISPDKTVKWDDFRREINNRLSECRVPEDKLIGPYFISKSILELDNIEIITESIKNKVLMYLYDDAVRGYRNNFFEPEKSKTYSQLCENFDKDGRYIFKRVLEIDSEVYISEESSENEVDNIKKINLDDVDDIDKSISCESNN